MRLFNIYDVDKQLYRRDALIKARAIAHVLHEVSSTLTTAASTQVSMFVYMFLLSHNEIFSFYIHS